MKKKKKKVYTLDELLAEETDRTTNRDKYARKYAKSLKDARADELEKNKKSPGKYSLKTRIKNNPWLLSRPASQAIRWMYKEVFKNPLKYRYKRRLMYAGGLFMFEYFNPKYKDTSVLPYFDQFPLVLSLGPVVTGLGPRNMGFNLHLLPPKIRIITLCYIFEIYKNSYRYGYFFKKEIYPINIRYEQVVDVLEKYGIKFCIRMYIPMRMKQIVHFPLADWHKAIFIPSRGYYDTRAAKLIKEWKTFCRNSGYSISPNIDWRSKI